jgi:hypothetical protein
MLSYGLQLTAPDPLRALEPEALAALVRTDEPLAQLTARLRRVRSIQPATFTDLKRGLPFVVGSEFDGGQRRKEHFRAAHHLILDFDHCLGTPVVAGRLTERLRADERVWLLYRSPSGEGLKAFFRLAEPATDPALYADAYRAFARHVADQTDLAGSIDLRTCDVTRACFLAHDPDAHFRPDARPVRLTDWLEPRAGVGLAPPAAEAPALPARPLDEAAYQQVRAAAGLRPTLSSREKQVFVPDILHQLPDTLRPRLAEHAFALDLVQPIHFGLKLGVSQGYRRGEVNVFYGKRGFSVVVAPKQGTSPDLNEALATLLADVLGI